VVCTDKPIHRTYSLSKKPIYIIFLANSDHDLKTGLTKEKHVAGKSLYRGKGIYHLYNVQSIYKLAVNAKKNFVLISETTKPTVG
jgi:hypothetical protein